MMVVVTPGGGSSRSHSDSLERRLRTARAYAELPQPLSFQQSPIALIHSNLQKLKKGQGIP